MKFRNGLIMFGVGMIALGFWVSGLIGRRPGNSHVPLWAALAETEIRGGVICYDNTEWDGFCPTDTGPCSDYPCSLEDPEDPESDYVCLTEQTDRMTPGAWRDDCLEVHAGYEDCQLDFVGCGNRHLCFSPKPCSGPDTQGNWWCWTQHRFPRIYQDHYAYGDDCPAPPP